MTISPTTRASLLLRLRDHEAWFEFVSLYEPVIYRVLGMTTGAVRVAKCRIISRLSVIVAEMEKST